jgi:hypothetical protein
MHAGTGQCASADDEEERAQDAEELRRAVIIAVTGVRLEGPRRDEQDADAGSQPPSERDVQTSAIEEEEQEAGDRERPDRRHARG